MTLRSGTHPRHPLGERALTAAERQTRFRAARAIGTALVRIRWPADNRSRAQRRHDAVATLTASQAEYAIWLESLPLNLQEGATTQAPQAIVELGLGELQTIEPPRGFGRHSTTRWPAPASGHEQRVRAPRFIPSRFSARRRRTTVREEMAIGRTDDPEYPAGILAFAAAVLFGPGSRTRSGPAVMHRLGRPDT